jgi:hypothetical protein
MFKKILMVIGAASLLLVGSCTVIGIVAANKLSEAVDGEAVERAGSAYKRAKTDLRNELIDAEFAATEREEREELERETYQGGY